MLFRSDGSGLRSTATESESQFRRTFLVRKSANRDTNHVASMLGAFDSTKKSSKEIPVGATIHDLDPYTFSNRDFKQHRIDAILRKEKKDM